MYFSNIKLQQFSLITKYTDTYNPCNTLAQLMRKEWVVKLKEQVEKQGTTFFFKQWGIWESDSIKYNKHVNRKMLYE